MAAFSDIDSKDVVTLGFFVEIDLYNRVTDSTTTLYLADVAARTDKVDGTLRDWSPRLTGKWSVEQKEPTPGQGRFVYHSLAFSIWIGDDDDPWLAYLSPTTYEWDQSEVRAYLVDLDADYTSSSDNGVQQEFTGAILRGPKDRQPNTAFRVQASGPFYETEVPNPLLSFPTKKSHEFVQPVVHGGSNSYLTVATNETFTTFVLNGYANVEQGMILLVHDSDEQVLVADDNGGAGPLTVVRGYNNTTPTTHAVNDWCYPLIRGANQLAVKPGASEMVLPFVFGRGVDNFGDLYEIASYGLGASTRLYAAPAPADVELWFSCGKGPSIKYLYRDDGDGTLDIVGAPGSPYNDLDAPAGVTIIPGGAIGAGYNYHLVPHIRLTGSYIVDRQLFDATGVAPGYDQSAIQYWARLKGITETELTGGTAITCPCGILRYLFENADWALGLTLTDVFYTGRISGWTAGDWASEYSETWFGHVVGAVPYFGNRARPPIMDVAQECADLVNADIWVRSGKLYPMRRAIWDSPLDTLRLGDCADGAWPVEQFDPLDVEAYGLTAKYGHPVLSEPEQDAYGTWHYPVEIPYSTTIRQVTEPSSWAAISRQYLRMYLSETWQQANGSGNQYTHLDHWEDAHQELLDHLAQPQIYVEARLRAHKAWIPQGETIVWSAPGITTRDGQVRYRKVTGGDTGGEMPSKLPVEVTLRSWHVEFNTTLARS